MKVKKVLVNAVELAEILSIPRSQVYRLSRRGEIPVVVAGHHYRYDPEEVIAALRKPARKDSGDELR